MSSSFFPLLQGCTGEDTWLDHCQQQWIGNVPSYWLHCLCCWVSKKIALYCILGWKRSGEPPVVLFVLETPTWSFDRVN